MVTSVPSTAQILEQMQVYQWWLCILGGQCQEHRLESETQTQARLGFDLLTVPLLQMEWANTWHAHENLGG